MSKKRLDIFKGLPQTKVVILVIFWPTQSDKKCSALESDVQIHGFLLLFSDSDIFQGQEEILKRSCFQQRSDKFCKTYKW